MGGLAYFCADESRADESEHFLRSYYAFAGERAGVIAGGAVRTPRRIRDVVGEFAGIGMNELVFTPTVARLDEVDRLADLVL